VIYRGVFCRESCIADAFVVTKLRQQYKWCRHRQPVIPSGNWHFLFILFLLNVIVCSYSLTGPNCTYEYMVNL